MVHHAVGFFTRQEGYVACHLWDRHLSMACASCGCHVSMAGGPFCLLFIGWAGEHGLCTINLEQRSGVSTGGILLCASFESGHGHVSMLGTYAVGWGASKPR